MPDLPLSRSNLLTGHADLISADAAVHGLVTNLAPGVAPLLERQASRRHLIFGPTIWTFYRVYWSARELVDAV